jgi:hypothetical protein
MIELQWYDGKISTELLRVANVLMDVDESHPAMEGMRVLR